jgi:Putative restriction endonuclease
MIVSLKRLIKITCAVDIGADQNEHDSRHKEEDEPLPLDRRAVPEGCRGRLVWGPQGRATRWRGLLHGPHPLHRNCVWKLHELFSALLDKRHWTITREDDVEMGDDWVPSPDVAVLRGNFDLLKDDWLKGTDVALLVEASHKTYASDRGRKLPRYAHNKIPIYWIVSIERRTVEVFSGPVGQGDLATYAGTPLTFHEGEAVPVEVDGSVVGHLDVTEIFS